MLDALMIVAGFIMAPNAYPGHTQTTVIYNTMPYENYETCIGHLKERGTEIGKYLMPTDTVNMTFFEGETILVVAGTRSSLTTVSHVTLTCKEN